MRRLYLLRVKEILARWPLLLLLAACQILFAYMASFAMGDRTPELRLALFSEDKGEVAARFAESLGAVPALTVVVAGSEEEARRLAREQKVLGAVIIRDGMEARVARGREAVRLVPARMANADRVVREHVALALVELRARWRLLRELDALGGEPTEAAAAGEAPLSVVYEGPPSVWEPSEITPGYGLPALFVLILALQGAFMMPGPDRRGLVLCGRRGALRDYAACMAALFSVWAVVLALFFVSAWRIYGVAAGSGAVGAFAALCFYCAALGGALAALGLRKAAAWIFVSWMFMNMTLGGGLWGMPFSVPVLRPFLPLEQVLGACAGTGGALFLSVAGGALAVAGVAAIWVFAGGPASRRAVRG
ncbi:MAG: ABC transporter permease [Clostridiales Family XIII bacterium]|jgi:ABC-type multidrug transport system fused ATPase/permease subunit|nr:ABC transporter permease [Clostridiales Family XIII bacterium]